MSATLVTGANGYIAGNIIKKLLESGESVIGSVRSFNKAENLTQLFPQEFKSGQLRFVEVDFKNYNPGNWNELNNEGQKLTKTRKVAKRDLGVTDKELGLPKISFEKTVVDTLKLIVELEKFEIQYI